MKKPFALYDLIVNGERLYVGVTVSRKRRRAQHITKMRLGRNDDVVLRVVKWFADRTEAHAAERERIRRYRPIENVQAKPGTTLAEAAEARRAARDAREIDRADKMKAYMQKLNAEVEAWLKTPEGAAYYARAFSTRNDQR